MPTGVTSRTQPTPQAGEVGSVGSAAAFVAISNRYEEAGPTSDHVNVGAVATLVEKFPGVNRVGLGRVPSVGKDSMFP